MGIGRERRQKRLDRQKTGSKTLAGRAKGRPGMSDVFLLSGISGLLFDSPFLSHLLLFFLSSPPSPFSLESLMVHSPIFQKTPAFFLLKIWLFCMALIEQLGDDSW